ncbi:MAG: flagellar protein FlgN [Rhodobacteraceae bacterium]|nr:flagellar protein FlgN [Paracoccaceae bacterium]
MTTASAVQRLQQLLAQERRALLGGDLARLADLAARKDACLDALAGASATEAELSVLRRQQQRNEVLLASALAGIGGVRALLQANGQGTSVYHPDGSAQPLGAPRLRLTRRL